MESDANNTVTVFRVATLSNKWHAKSQLSARNNTGGFCRIPVWFWPRKTELYKMIRPVWAALCTLFNSASSARLLDTSALQMKGWGESNINVWFPFMYSQKWSCYFQNRIIMFCHFLHSYICERFIYLQDWCAYSAAGKYMDRYMEIYNRSQTHECGNGPHNSQKRNT
jgi:hypothetical protein